MIPFGPQLIGQTEKALNALLQRVLSGRDLSERQWVTLRLVSQLPDGDDLDAFLADRLHEPHPERFLDPLRDRALIAGSALSPHGATLVAEVEQQITRLTGPIWAGIDAQEAETAARALQHVQEGVRRLLRDSAAPSAVHAHDEQHRHQHEQA